MATEHQTQNEILLDARWLSARRADQDVVLIDTRPAADFRAGHLKGARHFDPFPFHYSNTSEGGMREVRGQLEWIFSALGITGFTKTTPGCGRRARRGSPSTWVIAACASSTAGLSSRARNSRRPSCR
jgi:thiosulfate/3-mercaptopyruvate sulfurtransferase